MRVLGIDAGSTKTECVLADGSGNLLAKTRGPGVNFQLFGEDELEFVLSTITQRTLVGHDATVDALCLGIAGAGREEDYRVMRRILARLGCARENVVTHDALIALVAGAGQRYGVVLTVGTGATAYGINQEGVTARAGGWGHLLGDEGSAYWMGLATLRAVVRAHDGRSRPTLLKDAILERLGVENVDALVHRVYRQAAREEIAALAPLVQSAADWGDEAAQAIIDAAGREFLRAVESVIGQLELAGQEFHLVLSGGLWKAVPVLQQDFAALVKKIAPWARVTPLTVEPARGAVQLALDHLAPTKEEVMKS